MKVVKVWEVRDKLGILVEDAINYGPEGEEFENSCDAWFNPAVEVLVWLLRNGMKSFNERDLLGAPVVKSDPDIAARIMSFLLGANAVAVAYDVEELNDPVYEIDLSRKAVEV